MPYVGQTNATVLSNDGLQTDWHVTENQTVRNIGVSSQNTNYSNSWLQYSTQFITSFHTFIHSCSHKNRNLHITQLRPLKNHQKVETEQLSPQHELQQQRSCECNSCSNSTLTLRDAVCSIILSTVKVIMCLPAL